MRKPWGIPALFIHANNAIKVHRSSGIQWAGADPNCFNSSFCSHLIFQVKSLMELDRKLKIPSPPNDGIGIMCLCCLVGLKEGKIIEEIGCYG